MSTPGVTRTRARAAVAERIRQSLAGVDRVELLAPDISAPVVAERRVARDFYLRRFLAGVDVIALAVGVVAAAVVTGAIDLTSHGLWALATIPVWLLLFNLYGLYGKEAFAASDHNEEGAEAEAAGASHLFFAMLDHGG